MDELTRAPERILIDCLRALDGGARTNDCLSRYPARADDVRGVLDVRAQLLTLKTTAPSPAAFASGREALLARVVRPLASSHPGSTETQGRQARGLNWRPATRAAFAGALFFAMASCAIGVSATPAGDKARDALPDIPPIEAPEPRPAYPFPEFNDASGDILPTEEPDYSAPIEVDPPTDDTSPGNGPLEVPGLPGDSSEPANSDEGIEPANSDEGIEPADPGKDTSPKPSSEEPSNDQWIPPYSAEEPTAEATPDATPTEEPSDGDGRETYRRD